MKLMFLISLFTFQMGSSTAFAGYFDSREASCQPEQGQSQDGIALLRACQFSTDCLPSENCIRGQCVPYGGGGNCLGDTDCAIGEHCVAGRCIR